MESNNYGENSGVVANTVNGPIEINKYYHEKKKQIPSLLPGFIEKLAVLVLTEDDSPFENPNTHPYDIIDKINHNSLKAYKNIIDEYGSYYYTCERALEIIESSTYGAKQRILRNISETYKQKKRSLIIEDNSSTDIMDLVRRNADRLVEQVREEIKEKFKSSYTDENVYDDDLDFCLCIFVCYAFCECKILEKPVIK